MSVLLIYVVFFVLGTGETLADTASAAFVPAIVPVDALPTANSLLGGTFTVVNQFLAKPLGGWLFAVSAALPFGVNAASFAGSAALVAGLRSVPPADRPRRSPHTPPGSPSLRAEIADGVRWLWRHRLLRALAVTMAFGNLVFCAAFAIFVLYSQSRLGLSPVGYGALLTSFAIGGFLGTLVAPTLLRTFGATLLLRVGLLIEVALHATLAATTHPWAAGAIIVVFGVHTVVWAWSPPPSASARCPPACSAGSPASTRCSTWAGRPWGRCWAVWSPRRTASSRPSGWRRPRCPW